MKKPLLLAGLALGLGAAHQAQAQLGPLVNLVGAGVGLGVRAATKPKLTPEQKAALQADEQAQAAAEKAELDRKLGGPAIPAELHAQRTPADKLPKKGAEQVQALEAELERCHAALLAGPTGPVCSPAQRAAIQQAAVAVARTAPGWNLQPYQQEMAFYVGEDARRLQAAAAPAK